MNDTEIARRAGRPRSAEARRAILDATSALLSECGYAGLTMAAIAERAGVGKPTIYRRWPSKAEVVVATMTDHIERNTPPLSGDVRADLVGMLEHLRCSMVVEPVAGAMAGILMEAHEDPDLLERLRDQFFSDRRAFGRRVVQQGIDNGQIAADTDPDLVLDMLIAPFYLRLLVTGMPITEDLPSRLVDLVVGGAGA